METTDDYRGLLYRWGFVVLDETAKPNHRFDKTMATQNWRSLRIANFRIKHHPEARIDRHSLPDGATILFIGDAFVLDGTSVADRVARIGRADDASLALLALALSGRFALLAIGDFGARAYHDAVGSRTVYYSARGGFVIGSHPGLVAMAAGASRSAEIARFMRSPKYENLGNQYLPGDLTPFEGVHNLIPNTYLDSTGASHRYWPSEPLRRGSTAEFHRAIDDYLDKFVKFISAGWTPVLGVTGGMDSRSLLAAFKSAGVPFQSLTWYTQNYPSPYERDLIDRQVAHLGAPHRYVRRGPRADPALQKIVFANSERPGIAVLTQTLRRAFADQRDDGRAPAFAWGWGAEAMRGYYQRSDAPMTDLSAEQMAQTYWHQVEGPEDDREAWALAVEAFAAFRRRGNYDALDGLGYDPNDIFYVEHRMGKWCGLALNETDAAILSFVGFNARSIFLAAWGIRPAKRLTKRLFRRVVARRDPALATIPAIGLPVRKPLWRRGLGLIQRKLGSFFRAEPK